MVIRRLSRRRLIAVSLQNAENFERYLLLELRRRHLADSGRHLEVVGVVGKVDRSTLLLQRVLEVKDVWTLGVLRKKI